MSKRTLGVVFFPAFDWAISPTHPEREERLLYTQDQLREEGLFDLPGITEYKPGVATHEDIERVHFCLPDVGRVCSASHLASAGGAIRAGELVLSGERERAFALVRPPGHHAMRVTHGNRGFCNVNMEAVMIENLRRRFGPLRVAIVDTDCHHGDGTQDIYWNDPDTLFISMHQDGRTLYPGTGFLPEYGGPGALGRTVNIPLPPGTGDEGYLYVTKNVVLPLLEAFKPDLVINSAGQDNHYTDPLTNMQLSAHGYAAMNALLNPHIAVLEGGYSIRGALPYVNLGICLALAGLPFEHVHEPDHDAKALKQRPQVTEYISRLCDDVLNQYHNPPSRPSEGHRDGEWWRRERDIYYDTDGLSEHQNEGIRLCPDCPGLTCIETSSDRVDKSLCLLLPRNACPHCRELAHRLVETTGKIRPLRARLVHRRPITQKSLLLRKMGRFLYYMLIAKRFFKVDCVYPIVRFIHRRDLVAHVGDFPIRAIARRVIILTKSFYLRSVQRIAARLAAAKQLFGKFHIIPGNSLGSNSSGGFVCRLFLQIIVFRHRDRGENAQNDQYRNNFNKRKSQLPFLSFLHTFQHTTI